LLIAALLAAALTPYCIFSQNSEGGGVPGGTPLGTPAVAPVSPAAEGAAVSPGTPGAAAAPVAAGEAVAATPDENAGRPGTTASRAQEEELNFFGNAGGNAAGGDTLDQPAPRRPSSFLAILRMLLVLALVAALIYGVVYLLRRLGKPQTEQNPHLKILASAHLGSGRYIHAVSVGKNAYLVGSAEGGVNHIADLTDQEAVDAMALDASKKSAETPAFFDFQSLLKKFSGGISGKEQDRLENMRRRREKFRKF